MAQFNFDPNQHQIQDTISKLPTGWYPAVMIESDVVETKSKDGFRLTTMFQIIDGPGAGRKIPMGFNIQNPSAQTVEISMNQIKTMQVCMGIFAPIQDSQEMHGKPLQIRLIEPKDSDYNEIKGFKTINGLDAKDAANGGAAAGGPPVGHQAQPPQGFGQPPAPPAATPYPPAPAADPTAGWQRHNGYRLNPATNAWEPDAPAAPAPPPAPPAPAAAPSWAPPAAPAAPAPSYAPPAPPAAPAAPSWTPQTTGSVAAPSWAPPK